MRDEGELPEGWSRRVLAELVPPGRVITYGVIKLGPAVVDGVPTLRSSDVRFLQINSIGVKRIAQALSAEYSRTVLQGGETVVTVRGTLGGVAAVPKSMAGYNVSREVAVVPLRKDFDPRFIALAIGSVASREWLSEVEKGVAYTGINIEDLKRLPVSIPPPTEQARIVDKVEHTHRVIEGSLDRLSNAAATLRRFRRAVLVHACSGRLTESWRSIHQIDEAPWQLAERIQTLRAARRRELPKPPTMTDFDAPESWPVASMDALTIAITSGSRAWSKYYRTDGAGTFVMAQNVRPLRLDRTYRQAVAPPANDPERVRTAVMRGDLLATIVGANTGDVCRVADDLKEHYVCQSVAYMRPVLTELSPFLELWLNSPAHGRAQYEEWLYGEGRPHLSLDHLRETAVALPSLDEQVEIVRRVESLFALADAIEKRVAAASACADKLTQAILAKAFRGELVPTEAELTRRRGPSTSGR